MELFNYFCQQLGAATIGSVLGILMLKLIWRLTDKKK